jgi:hypothetical protein
LWNSITLFLIPFGIRPYQRRIREIEQGIEPEFYEVIHNYERAEEKYLGLARSIDKEGLLFFASSKAMIRAN